MDSGTNDKCSVPIADDSNLIQLGVRRLLKGEPRIEVLGSATSFEHTLQLAAQLKPQIVLLDLHMPDSAAFEPEFVKATLLNSVERIIAMSAWGDEASAIVALRYGATALLHKETMIHTLIPALLES
jgi:two-component system nitrate/nitrite response regulator NarL